MLFYTWCGVCKQIMVGLPVINYLRFFFVFSLLTAEKHNSLFCLLFVKSGIFVKPCQAQVT
jgi:hypothetical protein